MIVTIGQPGLFPWWGTFAKIAAADAVVHLDHVTWQKGGYLNRFCLDTPGTQRWSTIPLRDAHLGMPIRAIRSELPATVLPRHRTRLGLLADAPHASDAVALLESVYRRATDDVCATAIDSTDAVSDYLALSARAVRSSDYPTQESSTAMLLHLLRELGATGYLFGGGRRGLANHYLDIELLKRAGLRVGVAQYGDAPRVSILERIATQGRSALDGTAMEITWL